MCVWGGYHRQEVLSNVTLCDEIHLNVLMISVCSCPGCIFVNGEKKKDCICETFPLLFDEPQLCRGALVKQCVPYLKNEAFFFFELVCTLPTPKKRKA